MLDSWGARPRGGEPVKLFPHALIRFGGEAFDRLDGLRAPGSLVEIEKRLELKRRLTSARDRLCDALFQAVHDAEDRSARKRLLQIKRDIYNARDLSPSQSQWLGTHPMAEIRTATEDLNGLLQDLERLQKRAESTFAEELSATRRHLRILAQMTALTKGLFLSSGPLTDALAAYLAADADSERLSKKMLKTELSLVKYITRICAKTSPFSTFNALAMARLHFRDAGAERPWLSPGKAPVEPTSFVRLNNTLFQYLREILFRHPRYREHLALRPNPTLRAEGEAFLFLTNSNNVESFQRIPSNPVLELLLELTRENRQGLPFGKLVAAAGNHVDATAEELSDYVTRLIDFGFLEFNLGISGTDTEWDRALAQTLSGWDQELPMIGELTAMLADLRSIGGAFGNAEPKTRRQLLTQAFELFRDVCLRWHASAGLPEEERLPEPEYQAFLKQRENEKTEAEEEEDKDEAFEHRGLTRFGFKAEQLFYEDCAFHGQWELEGEEIQPLLNRIDLLFEALGPLDGFAVERLKMKHFFQQHYSGPVDLLTFYEAYYREFKKPEAEHEARRQKEEDQDESQDQDDERFQIPALKERQALSKAFQREFRALLSCPDNADRVDFDLQQLRTALKAAGFPDREGNPPRRSCAVFSQIYRQDGEAHMVLNGALPGWGKYFSRFLHVFDHRITEDLRDWNAPASSSVLFLEAQDASVFNANLHPPLLPYEIWIPGGHNSLPPRRQIPITDIQISLDPREDMLVLHSTRRGCRLHVLDLGFQSLLGRSELFQMLQYFNPVQIPMLGMLIEALREPKEEKSANGSSTPSEDARSEESRVTRGPRIVFENRVVLRRRTWHFPKPTLPVRASKQSDWSYFCQVHDWKQEHGLPDQVFASITHHGELRLLKETRLRKLSRDDYKPQYLDFANPLLIRLFEKLIGKTPRAITIAEMLPQPDQLCAIQGRPHVTEATLQWYRGEG